MPKIILFDGDCNLCSGSIDFIVKHDKNHLFSFVSLQSDEGQNYLKQFHLATSSFDTIVLIDNNKIYIKSTAILMIIKNLSSSIKHLYIFIVIPQFIRDYIYNLIAKYRFSFFTTKKTCKTNITK